MSSENLDGLLGEVKGVYPTLVGALTANLATVGILCFQDYTQPVSLINVGNSGCGKTTVLDLIMPDRESTQEVLFRCDNFTPASFVSHATNVKKRQLKEIDLLPKIENKTLVTKELAPVFRGNKDDLLKTFAILTAVLDGQGYVSQSGVHGTRGYDRRLVFSWLGATTPLSQAVHAMMAQLGGRLLFWNMDSKPHSHDELAAFVQDDQFYISHEYLRGKVNDFLEAHFEKYPPRSVNSSEIEIDDREAWLLAGYARVLARMRSAFRITEVKDDKKHTEPVQESEYRIIVMFKSIVRSLALMNGRRAVSEDDLRFIRHIALSSMPEQRRKILKTLLEVGDEASTQDLLEKVDMSRPTLLGYMEEIGHLGVCSFHKGSHDSVSYLSLNEEFCFLLPEKGEQPEDVPF
ncbi:hypothetical protein MYX65_05615 [Acidobacteria bacterium AH-259-L09]|nr:hypothetical protein [Acidobacteria bacterium AH-259-L09]